MNIDFGTLCILGFIVLLGAFLLPRLLSGFGSPYGQRGSEFPRYNDPNIRSRGGFGGRRSIFGSGRGGESARYDSPDVQSRGGFGGSRSSSQRSSSMGGAAKSYDSPKVQSRGGFGRSKK
jgi:hypothetical protein